MIPSIIQIGEILVSSEIITERFCCDCEVCRGACCIIGDSGAPLADGEDELLERHYEEYKSFMSEEGCRKVAETGFFEIDIDGDAVTPLLGGSEECAFTHFEGRYCMCAVERAWCLGSDTLRARRGGFVKPISCRLYPIRAKVLSNGLTALNLHRWDICKCAFEKGRRDDVPVYKFLREPLIAAYGEEFYKELCEVADYISSAS